jgi:hypothetical protein
LGILYGNQYIVLIISCSFLLRIINVLDESFRENQSTHFRLNIFFSENSAVYEIMWKNIVDPDMQKMTVWRMRILCWILFFISQYHCNLSEDIQQSCLTVTGNTSSDKSQSQLIGCGSSFMRFLDHTQRRTTDGRTPLDE